MECRLNPPRWQIVVFLVRIGPVPAIRTLGAWIMRWSLIANGFLVGICVVLVVAPGSGTLAADARPDPAQRHRAVEIGAGDRLNVRVQPDPESEIVGTLDGDSAGIVITGLHMAAGAGAWWEIVHEGAPRGTGWVNARFLAPEPAGKRESGFALLCRGTEPFWSVALKDGRAQLSRPGSDEMSWRAGPWMNAAGLQPGWRFAIRVETADGAGRGWASISRAVQGCSDQMSDFDYPYDATVITPDGNVLAGCCTRAP